MVWGYVLPLHQSPMRCLLLSKTARKTNDSRKRSSGTGPGRSDHRKRLATNLTPRLTLLMRELIVGRPYTYRYIHVRLN
jgi:hypothetical protein